MKRLAIILVLALAMSGIASADTILSLNSGPIVNGGNFNWTYTAVLKSGSTLDTGDFFTLYDIGGFGPGVPIAGNVILPCANWSSSIQLLGTNGFAQSPPIAGPFTTLRLRLPAWCRSLRLRTRF
jgi:hypothetical protein